MFGALVGGIIGDKTGRRTFILMKQFTLPLDGRGRISPNMMF